ncbi:MAG: flagellar basal body L-ring protein FlgH [Sinobacterium sp.]|nr:flagellar basal body L-ring protein FlgH [Sinobacterium sp.]
MSSCFFLSACSGSAKKQSEADKQDASSEQASAPIELPNSGFEAIDESSGSIYSSAWNMSLFDDNRARKVGDTIVVHLIEETNASKQSSTSTAKTQGIDVAGPTIFGRPVTYNGVEILETSVDSDQGFDGAGSSSQSNKLTGAIAVLVQEVLPNGNLVVEGEKWLTINQGEEFVKLKGIIRPSDIETDNSISSWKVANAEITYGAEGVLADANRMGWFGRIFQSIFSPF